MTLDVSQALKQPGTAMPMDAEQAIAPVEIGGDTVTFEPARLAGSFMALEGGDIVVRGILTTRAHARCANCLSPAEADVEEEFDEVFHLGGDPDDPEIFAYTGQELELEQLAMSTAVLGLPIRFLCREGCSRVPASDVADVVVSLAEDEERGQRPFAALKELLAKAESGTPE